MKLRIFRLLAVAAVVFCGLAGAQARAQNAYIPNEADGTVLVIDTATNTVIGSPITVGTSPVGVAVTPGGSKVYVANFGDSTVSVIDTATNTVTTIAVGTNPVGVAVTPDGSKVYVTNQRSTNVSVIDTATNTVIGSPINRRHQPLRRGGNPGRRQGLCHQRG
jgi:YVTN family beta-propeller protein